MLKSLLRPILKPFGFTAISSPKGLRLARRKRDHLVYLHNYAGGYEEYRATQVFHNHRKLDKVWADEGTLGVIADDIAAHLGPVSSGCCHGARNGFEVEWLARRLNAKVIGTDISETVSRFPNLVVWDFHQENPEWRDAFDFIYTNSLDQAFEPDRALATWAAQLRSGGRI